ncbi:hypothetical protein QE422_000612 [Chryseobacterium sp. SORGH_AS 447]|nr:hypothetical protein [Chryseobacterium sp. SORGH_AS_0447]
MLSLSNSYVNLVLIGKTSNLQPPTSSINVKRFTLNSLNLSIGLQGIANNRQFPFGKKAVNLKSSK